MNISLRFHLNIDGEDVGQPQEAHIPVPVLVSTSLVWFLAFVLVPIQRSSCEIKEQNTLLSKRSLPEVVSSQEELPEV